MVYCYPSLLDWEWNMLLYCCLWYAVRTLLKTVVTLFIISVAFMATTSGALEIAQSSSIRSMRNVAGDGWCNFRENIPGLQRKASGLFPGFGIKNPLEKGMDISNMKTAIFSSSKPMMNQSERIGSHFFHPQKGLLFSTKQLHMSTFRFTFTVTNWKNPFQLDNHKNGFNMHLYCCNVIFICCCWLSIISLASCFCFPLAKIFCSYIFSIYYFVSLFWCHMSPRMKGMLNCNPAAFANNMIIYLTIIVDYVNGLSNYAVNWDENDVFFHVIFASL